MTLPEQSLEKIHLYVIKGVIAELSPEQQSEIERHAANFRKILKEEGKDGSARFAFALVCAEIAAEE